MSLLFIDGFDHYETLHIPVKWTSHTGAAVNPTGGRRGGGAAYLASFGCILRKSVTPSAGLVLGYAVQVGALPASGTQEPLARFLDGDTVQVSLHISSSGALKVYRGEGYDLLLETPGGTIVVDLPYYIELKAVFHATTGSVGLQVTTTLGEAPTGWAAAAVNTTAAGVALCDEVEVTGGGTTLVDDLYILNLLGSENNDFLGDSRIDTHLPSAVGMYSNFTPSEGGANYETVNDNPPGTAYVRGSSVGAKDAYTLPSLAALTGSIHAVQLTTFAQASVEGECNINHLIHLSGVAEDDLGDPITLGITPVFQSTIFPQNPDTLAAWTEAQVNTAQFGVRVAE